MTVHPNQSILVVDFGSQVTQLIARRVREAGVYCEIAPFNASEEAFERLQPRGVIFSGGPASVTEAESPQAPQIMFDSGVPLLAICYGQQTLHQQLGGKVVSSDNREFGRAFVEIVAPSALFDGLWNVGEKHQVWMSHGDRVETLAPGFEVVAASPGAPFAIATNEEAKRYSLMFHPEVVHTPDGGKLLANFVRHVCGCSGDWTMASFREAKIADIREQVGKGRVICGLSGGVDSAVAAVLIHEAIGEQLTCVFVDHGLMRQGEAEQVVSLFRNSYNIPLVHVDASADFLGGLEGVTDPEAKRKFIGAEFINVFEEEAKKIGGADFLAQGTLYPDVIESVSGVSAAVAAVASAIPRTSAIRPLTRSPYSHSIVPGGFDV
jgi:GMP synthase (glutamine-hydrolysing)